MRTSTVVPTIEKKMEKLQAKMILADHAAAENGKLYLNGAGWSMIAASVQVPMGIGLMIEVPYDMTNQQLALRLRLLDEDGGVVSAGGKSLDFEIGSETGRPPGLVHGQLQRVMMAINIAGIDGLEPGKGYRWELTHDGRVLDRYSFRTRPEAV